MERNTLKGQRMELEVSPKMKRTAKKFGLSVEELSFADLISVGWLPEDAFIAAFRKGATWMKGVLKEQTDKMMEKEGVMERIDSIKGKVSAERIEAKANEEGRGSVVSEAMSKEKMLYDLQMSLGGMKPGSKEWLDIKKLIVEVTRMKQEEVKDEETTIHHYLPVDYPVSCKYCLRNPANKKGGK